MATAATVVRNYTLLKSINQTLRYKLLSEFIGTEIAMDISSETFIDDLKTLIQEQYELTVIETEKEHYLNAFRKYGILDLEFKIDFVPEYPDQPGLRALKENAWLDKEGITSTKENERSFLEEVNNGIEPHTQYLKIFAKAEAADNWADDKSYLIKQLVNEEAFQMKPGEEVMNFKVEDICYTNYPQIWLWKHLYF
ncbi:MAG: hypothetical protein AAFV80_23515 [Bacteroidota bacterium]